MKKFVIRDEINFKLEPKYLQESAIVEKIKKEINETESEETITPSNNAGQIKLEHDENSIKSLSCHICNSKLKSKFGLRQHMNIHTRERLFKCSECNKEFTQKVALNQHLKTHSNKRLQYSCTLCDSKLITKDGLNKHMKRHAGENLFKSSICNGEFRQKYKLNWHTKTHKTERLQFSCKFCDKKLTSKRTLKEHMNKHTRENLYKCSECDREFTNRGNLNQHLTNIHGKERSQFSCKLCDKKVATKCGLRQHINSIHTREILFKCLECNREFTQKANLKSHLKTHSKERLQKISQTSSERRGGRLSDVDGKPMNKSTTALSNIIKSEKMGSVETDLTEYFNTEKPELNIEENESSRLAYSTCYSETICKEEVILPDEID